MLQTILIESPTFRNKAPFIPLKKRKSRRNRLFCCLSASYWFSFALFTLRPSDWRLHVPLKRRSTFNGLDVVISFFFNLQSGGWNQGPLDTAAT
jgi:hypothetical protein